MHRWLYDLQITGNKRGVTNPFFSLPHHILFFFYLFLFSIVLLLLVSLLCNPCLSLTPLSPASFYFAFLCYTSVCFLCLLFSVSDSPRQFCSALFQSFYPISPFCFSRCIILLVLFVTMPRLVSHVCIFLYPK